MFIKFNLVKLDKAIVFQILEQDLRKTPSRGKLDMMIDGYNIIFARSSYPEIRYNQLNKKLIIMSRGSASNKHLDPSHIYFDNNFDRDEIFDILVKSLKEVSSRYK